MYRIASILMLLIATSTWASDGPVCSWNFDKSLSDPSGASSDDFSACSGVARFVHADELPGVDGQAIAIGVQKGDAQYLSAAASADTRIGATYTIEAWIHPTRLSSSWNRLLLCWSKERAYHFAIHGQRASLYHAQANRKERTCEGGQLKPNYWYHVAAVARQCEENPADSTIKLYLNGNNVATTSFDGTINTFENSAIGLGDSADGAGSHIRYRGYVDGVTIWKRALSEDEVQQRCKARADILNKSSWSVRIASMAATGDRLELAVELERIARETDLDDDMMETAAKLLDDSDPFVRAMAEWAIARKVGRDNNHEEVRWTEKSDAPWLKRWLAIPMEDRIEMDWCRQAVSLGIYNDAAKLHESMREYLDRAIKMEASSEVQWSLLSAIRKMCLTGDLADIRNLWLECRRIMRRLAFDRANLDFDEIILFNRYAMHYKPNVCGVHTSWSYKPGGDLVVVSGLEEYREEKSLIQGKLGPGHVHGMDLWFDADRVAFAWANQPEWPPRFSTRWPRGNNDCYSFELRNTTVPPHLYELDIESGEITQLTDHNFWSDVEPTYCPDGTIAFTSDRSAHSPSCDGQMNDLTDHNLYSISADRKRIRRLTNQKDIDMHPHLLDNGLIAYLRWEYQERHFWDVHSVWTVKPDGTMSDALFKQHLGAPLSVRDVRSVPGTSKLVAIAAGHHSLPKGPVVILDPTAGINNQEGIQTLTTGSIPQEMSRFKWERTWDKTPVNNGGVQVAGGYFMMPYALSEQAFLVSYGYGNAKASRYWFHKSDVDSNGLGVYLIDSWGNMELIYRHPIYSSYGVLPHKKRKRPPVLPDMVDMSKNFATCVIPDVYEGMESVERGTIRSIRIAEALPWPIVPGEGVKRWDLSNRWCPVRVIGTVPVEADGSAHFKVPVADNASVYFQVLDENEMEVRRMRSSISFQPGERRACNGCHETAATPPANQQGIAAGRAPDMPQPPPWGANRQVGFDELVQPILDARCVACHGSESPKAGLIFSQGHAYKTITSRGLVSVSPREGDGSITVPYQYGSHKSRFITRLLDKDSPCGRDLEPEEWTTLVTWVDANAPHQGLMWEKRAADGRGGVWSPFDWKDCWAPPAEVPATGPQIDLPNNSWREALQATSQ